MNIEDKEYPIAIKKSQFINVFPNSSIIVANGVASKVSLCIFEVCRNDFGNGGAISFITNKQILVTKSCFSKCHTTKAAIYENLGQALNIQNSKKSQVNFSIFDQCPTKEEYDCDLSSNNAVINSMSAIINAQNSNITRTRCYDGTAFACFYEESQFNGIYLLIYKNNATNTGMMRASEGGILMLTESIVSHSVGKLFFDIEFYPMYVYHIMNCWLSENENLNMQQYVSTNNISTKNGFQMKNFIECEIFISSLNTKVETNIPNKRKLGIVIISLFLINTL